MAIFLKLLHVLTAIWLISGIVGRTVTFRQAARTQDIHTLYTLLQISDFFERRMVIPASATVLLFGLLTAWWQGWPILGFLQGSGSNWLLVSLVLYLILVPAIPLYLVPRRKARTHAAEDSLTQARITPELTAALADRGVATYRLIEFTVIVLITILMVVKPF